MNIVTKQNSDKMTLQYLILIASATSTALIAGLFYAYACSVNPGLGKLSDDGYLAAMQSINREIQNPVFFASFVGTLFLLPLSAWVQYREGNSNFLFLLAAALIYVIGSFGVTIFGNVPLNETLDKFNLSAASMEEVKNQRNLFEISWNRLHTIRTVTSIFSLLLVIIACMNVSNK